MQPSSMGFMQAVAPATMAGSWPSACVLCMLATPDLARHSAQHMQLHSLQGSVGLQRQWHEPSDMRSILTMTASANMARSWLSAIAQRMQARPGMT